jgi:alkanesulfonate monooxygenase SsuD/methylene tetrahydromethanopterin reductase-like flavin-dependent oxidoreductase (luciferase family)
LNDSADTARLKIDRGIPSDLTRVQAAVATLEQRGYDGCWTGEIDHDPFLPVLLAAEHTSALEVGTSIAVAFARTPMTVAHLGWDLQSYSAGRFNLGLGTQVKAHIEKRFGMPWSHPSGACGSSSLRSKRFGPRGATELACVSRVTSTPTR